ncbi:hypothetical protein I4F81_010882 [Pyropia yezoensis]|uniref:Uncharacterized protein n=1 Tax=Pyropia yezoensis TaxID=2788 RepID=A0ACC3CEW4_PYRYE|nr:hypothetical protein I4F81_010882 [Neopyropia yezoensis]
MEGVGAAADAAAEGLAAEGVIDSDDEADEVQNYGPGALPIAKLRPAGAVAVGELQYDLECSARVACRTSSGNVASFAMSESSWSRNEKVASRFIRFLAAAYGVVAGPAGPTIEQQGEHLATTLEATLPHRIRRFFVLIREGERKHLVGGNNAPLKTGTIDNMASSPGHFFAMGIHDFPVQFPYVLGCASRAQAYNLIPTAVRGARKTAAGETHTRNPLLDSTVADWLSGAAKQATRLGQAAAQTPPVTSENMIAACDAATTFLDGADVDHVELTVQQVERLTLFTVMIFSWCTMLRPDNLLGLAVRDVVFAPLHGANFAFFQEHGRPRWVKVSYTRLKTNVTGTAPVPAYYFWSSLASTEEMQASPQCKESSLGTMRARVQDCFRVDRQDLMERLDGLVGDFMSWFEDRVIELHEENYGNFFGAGFGVEVAGKLLGMVDVLLRTHGGMLDGEAA